MNEKPWELDLESISMLDISTISIIQHERQRAQAKLLEYLKFIKVQDYEITNYHGIGLAIKHEDLKELEESLE